MKKHKQQTQLFYVAWYKEFQGPGTSSSAINFLFVL